MTSRSPFTMTMREASDHVRNYCADDKDGSGDADGRRCYLLQLFLRRIYGGGPLPSTTHHRLTRVLNDIPLGPGVLTSTNKLRWRYVEAGVDNLAMFLSDPMTPDEAESTQTLVRDVLATNGDDVFGGEVVKAFVVLSECRRFDSAAYINDIAKPVDRGLHFRK